MGAPIYFANDTCIKFTIAPESSIKRVVWVKGFVGGDKVTLRVGIIQVITKVTLIRDMQYSGACHEFSINFGGLLESRPGLLKHRRITQHCLGIIMAMYLIKERIKGQ